MFGIGPMELVVIVVVALLIFGPQKLPEFARTIGKGLAEFRRASNDLRQSLALDELQSDLRKTMNDATRAPAVRPAQAGDTLPPGASPTAGPGAGAPPAASAAAAPGATTNPASAPDPLAQTAREASAAAPAAAGSAAAAAGSTPVASPPWKGHPGELPEGIDHDHHATEHATEHASEHDPEPEIDSELGNVPVGGGAPSEARRG